MTLITHQNVESRNFVQISREFSEHVVRDDEDGTVSVGIRLHKIFVVLAWANNRWTTSEVSYPAGDLFFPI